VRDLDKGLKVYKDSVFHELPSYLIVIEFEDGTTESLMTYSKLKNVVNWNGIPVQITEESGLALDMAQQIATALQGITLEQLRAEPPAHAQLY
jgi:hypothetical protein